MKIETYLNAMERAEFERVGALLSNNNPKYHLRTRQSDAFRNRILRMDAEKDDVIEGQFKAIVRQHETIMQLRNEIGTWEEIDELMFDEKDHEPAADAG